MIEPIGSKNVLEKGRRKARCSLRLPCPAPAHECANRSAKVGVLLGSRKEAVTVENEEGGYLFDGNLPSTLGQALVQPSASCASAPLTHPVIATMD